jgi:hypothetical protein
LTAEQITAAVAQITRFPASIGACAATSIFLLRRAARIRQECGTGDHETENTRKYVFSQDNAWGDGLASSLIHLA